MQQGNRTLAYQLALSATQASPDSADAWLLRSRLAASPEETLFSMSQVHRINPNHPLARQDSFRLVWELLERDPYLAYQGETDDLYLVHTSNYMSIALPKDRAVPEPFPPKKPGPLAPANRWLGLAFIGILFSGTGTLIFAPLAILSAAGVLLSATDTTNRIRAGIVILVSLALLSISAVLVWVLYLHLRG